MQIHTVIVYGSRHEVLVKCLDSLLAQNMGQEIGITVVNNTLSAPSDDLLNKRYQRFAFYRWINNQTSLGYSANNNLAIRSTSEKAPFTLLLNDDVILRDRALAQLVDAIRSQTTTGAVGPTILNQDGTLQWGKVPFPVGVGGLLQALIGNKPYLKLFGARTSYFLIGACLLLRTAALDEVGFLDEGFDPGYAEDMDLCWRLIQAGWQVHFCPEARVVHLGGSSFGQYSAARHKLIFHNLFRFARKWRPGFEVILLMIAWLIGITARLVINSLGPKRKYTPISYSEALQAILLEFRYRSD